MQRSVRTAGAVCALALALAAGCGPVAATSSAPTAPGGRPAHAAPAAASTAHGRTTAPTRRFRANPALAAASAIVLVAPVVPFSPEQVKKLLPILESLAKDPDQPPAELSAKAREMLAVLTPLQREALQNLRRAHFASPSGQAPRLFRRPAAGSRPRRAFDPAAIYQRAILVLEGKATGGFGGFPGASATAGA